VAIKRIGQILVDLGFITPEQLQEAVDEQKKNRPGELFGKVALDLSLITEDQLAQALGKQLNMPVVSLVDLAIPPEVLKYVTEPMAQLYRIIPLSFKDDTLTIAMCDPQKLSILDELRSFLGFNIRAAVATERDVRKALDRYYAAGGDSIEGIIADMEHDAELSAAIAGAGPEGPLDLARVEAMADSAPVRTLLNIILLQGIRDRASDIHFEPFETEFKVRMRADGVLFELVPPPRHLALALTTRIKVMANLDIAERRLPQDGRIRLNVGGHPIDLRVSMLPTMFGESCVLRILDRSVVMLDLNATGMDPPLLARFREVIHRPNGIVLVTGPTGSGKTTTLYGALNELNVVEDKLITTEDPVEYEIEGIVQIPIDPGIGNTFAQCLRSILRQDPDKILVGEIRDLETAEIAVQASLTGHMVFSTLHTNDAPSTVTRLRDMGIPPFLITATLEAILAQRLVRKICADCREESIPSTEVLSQLDLTPDELTGKKFYRGRGCSSCNSTGYRGRTGLFEYMLINDQIRELINQGASTEKLRDCAIGNGMKPLREYGLEKIFSGLTTADEVIRETIHEI
jgi:type IV pilus assembly protein PilB